MWVYAPQSLLARDALPPAEQFWLDYWLHLHSDDVHAVWAARPLGLASVADTALALERFGQRRTERQRDRPPVTRALARGVASDLLSYRRLERFLPTPPPAGDPLDASDRLTVGWTRWSHEMCDPAARRHLITGLTAAACRAVEDENLFELAFLARRLAAELGDEPTSRHRYRAQATWAFLSGDVGPAFPERLRASMYDGEDRTWVVRLGVTSTRVNRALVQTFTSPAGRLVTVTDGDDGARRLVALEYTVLAPTLENAVLLAHRRARRALQQLRTRYYLRVNLDHGATAIGPDGEPVGIVLPQPFWARGSPKRAVPSLPKRFSDAVRRASADDAARWDAARWQVSQAIAVWAEDQHVAASHVWQALEAFSGGPKDVLDRLDTYVDALRVDLLDDLARKLTHQARRLRVLRGSCDWFSYDDRRMTPDRWRWNVLDGPMAARRWRDPGAPLVAFAARTGLVIALGTPRRPHATTWMDARLRTDMAYLYGLRNLAVHQGHPLGTERWAAHLARCGLEMLFSLLDRDVEERREPVA